MKVFLLYILSSILLLSCLMPEEPPADSLTIMTWNVQNLFDADSSGMEYEEYDPLLSDWNEDKMRIKLENLREVLFGIDSDLPDILLLQEVENRDILVLFNQEYLDGYYNYAEAWSDRESAICSAVLSRYTPDEVHLHFPGIYGKRQLRPLVEIHFTAGREKLILFNNHWKSRSGGQAATEDARIRISSLLCKRISELHQSGFTNILVAGDLNGSREDFRSGGTQTAQIPVEELHSLSWTNSLYVSHDPQDTFMESEKTILYSPWDGMESEGSYFFQNRWMKLDHFLLDRGLLDDSGLEYLDSNCAVLSLMCDEDGHPFGWESWRTAGYSDHFPLILSLGDSDSE